MNGGMDLPRLVPRCLGRWLLLLGVCLGAAAPPPKGPEGRLAVRAITTQDGLPQNAIQALAMDRIGRLWVGTTGGPAYQDGGGWTPLDVPDQANSDYVTAILPATDESLWIARQDGGVSRLSQGAWTTFAPRTGWYHARVNALAESRDPGGESVVWAGTHGAGLARYGKEGWRQFTTQDGLPDNRVWRIYPGLGEDHRETLFVGTDEGGVVQVRDGAITPMPRLPRASVNSFIQVQETDGSHTLWAGTFGFGIARWDGRAWIRFTQKDGLPSDFVTDFAQTLESDGSPALWVATLRGLAVLRHGIWETLNAQSGLPGNVMYRLLTTRTGEGLTRLWVGTGGHGLFIIDPSGWRKVDRTEGLPDSSIHAVLEVDGVLYAGTALGLARYDRGRWVHVFGKERITALRATGPQGRRALWVGTLSGLDRLEGGRWTHFDQTRELGSNRITDVVEGHGASGAPALWVTTDGGGLSCLDQGKWVRFGPEQGLGSRNLHTVLETPATGGGHYLWVGTRDRGVFRRNPDSTWTAMGADRGLPNLNIQSICRIRTRQGSDELWAATFGKGVVRLDLAQPDGRWTALPLDEVVGTTFDMVQGILQHPSGEVYLTTVRGVLRLIPTTGSTTGYRTFAYTTAEGLPSDFCVTRALLLDQQGRVLVGTVEGLALLDTRHSPPDRTPKALRFRGLSVNGKPMPDPGDGELVLSHDYRTLQVTYTLIAHLRTREHRFRSQLLGVESEPSGWQPERTRDFLHLPSGPYRLVVWGRDHAGNQSGPITLRFRVLPAIWETWWFRVLALGTALGALWLVIRWRERLLRVRTEELRSQVHIHTQTLRATNLNLEREIQERRAAESAKDDFTAMVSHELRTPLTAIRGALGLLIGGGPPDETTRRSLLEMAHRNTLRLLALVNDLLDIQKIEAGRMVVTREPMDLRTALEGSQASNQSYFDELGVELRLTLPPEQTRVMADPIRLDQVMANLLSNAAKFSARGAQVQVWTEPNGAHMRILVSNLGENIPEDFRPHLFQKFSQAERGTTRAVKGTGLGLAITKAVVEGMGGTVGFQSQKGVNTFWVDLPTTQEPPLD